MLLGCESGGMLGDDSLSKGERSVFLIYRRALAWMCFVMAVICCTQSRS
jgi:hypothetical protein